jgi:hypothetical protein
MKIVPQHIFLKYTVDFWKHLHKVGSRQEVWQLEKLGRDIFKADKVLRDFLIEVVALDLGYLPYTEKDKDYKSKNNAILCGLAVLMFVLLKAEITNTAIDERGFYQYSLAGFKRRYYSINQLERIWKKAYESESYIFSKFMNGLFETYISIE